MLITKEQLLTGKHEITFRFLVNGSFGCGKTYFAMTFPKFAYAQIEPSGLETLISNPALQENMVYYESFIPSRDEPIANTFQRLENYIKKVREDAKGGTIKTLIVDNLTHLAENKFIEITEFEKLITKKIDIRGLYGHLRGWLYQFVVLDCLSLPCHLVIPVHQTDEEISETNPQTGKEVSRKTGKIISNVLGSFREGAAGLFNASLFLEIQSLGGGKYKRTARCMPGMGKDAKNNVGLPEIVENISYQTIVESIKKFNPNVKIKGE